MTNPDQDLLDRFAIAAMPVVSFEVAHARMGYATKEQYADHCYALAIEMKKARDRIFTTAQPAQMEAGPFPKLDPIDLGVVEGTKAKHPFEPFELTERN